MSDKNLSRSEVLARLATLPLAGAAIAAVSSAAEAKIPPTSVQYVDKAPAGKPLCSACKFYIPGKNKTAKGGCQQVSGAIAPGGWCVVWAKK